MSKLTIDEHDFRLLFAHAENNCRTLLSDNEATTRVKLKCQQDLAGIKTRTTEAVEVPRIGYIADFDNAHFFMTRTVHHLGIDYLFVDEQANGLVNDDCVACYQNVRELVEYTDEECLTVIGFYDEE